MVTAFRRVPSMDAFRCQDPVMTSKSSAFDQAVARLHHLTHPDPSLPAPMFGQHYSAPSPPKRPCALDPAFAMSYPYRGPRNVDEGDDSPTIIDTFSPKPPRYELSPASSSSSDQDSSSSSRSRPLLAIEAFFATRSRVVRLYNLPASAESFLSAMFNPYSVSSHLVRHVPVPTTLWELRDEYTVPNCDSIWAVFKTHEEACASLSLAGPAMSVATALESDLEPFHNLKRFLLSSPAPTHSTSTFTSRPPLNLLHPQMLHISSPRPDLHGAHHFAATASASKSAYTISTNPPNPRTSFRLGDWICNSSNCAAHNFGRNVSCIGCGNPRTDNANGTMPPQNLASPANGARVAPSPRFTSVQENMTFYSSSAAPIQSSGPTYSQPTPQSPAYQSTTSLPQNTGPPKTAHPLLTPSGRAFAVGGRVQNISGDPLNPCVMYWPDNEPFPEQGQIRPSGLVGVPQPPIMNTGNRGPISHQPGDWICKKCNYLNWRRRKVCQTCLPYAEGNGDSISAAVQAERIALLTSVLTQTQRVTVGMGAPPASEVSAPPPHVARSHSLTPPQVHRRFVDVSPPQLSRAVQRPVHRSQSHFQLGVQFSNSSPQYTNPTPIYQTSGHQTSSGQRQSPIYATGPEVHRFSTSPPAAENAPEPAHLLPSFFQELQERHDVPDLTPSPSLSPTATTASSTDLSLEDYDGLVASTATLNLGPMVQGTPSVSAADNIWKLDGEETKTLSAFPLPNQEELLGTTRKTARDQLRAPDAGGTFSMYNIRN